MLIKLPDQVITTEDLEVLISSGSTKKLSPKQQDLFKAFLEVNRFDLNNESEHLIIQQLNNLANKVQKASCIFAQTPDSDFLSDLTTWFRQNITSLIVIETLVDPTIIGGLILRTPEHIYDWSWQKKLIKTKPELARLVSHVN